MHSGRTGQREKEKKHTHTVQVPGSSSLDSVCVGPLRPFFPPRGSFVGIGERCFPATRKEQKNTLRLTWLLLSQACCCFVVCVVVFAAAAVLLLLLLLSAALSFFGGERGRSMLIEMRVFKS